MVVSRNPEYVLTLVQDSALKAVYYDQSAQGAETTEALVVFASRKTGGQIISSMYCTANDPVYFPAGAPLNIGEGFRFWSMGDGQSAVTERDIHNAIPTSNGLIVVYPVYESSGTQTYTVTLQFQDAEGNSVMDTDSTTYKDIPVGEGVTVEAADIQGYHFKCWKDGDRELAYTSLYRVLTTGDVTLTAVYDVAPVEPMSMVAITNQFRSMNGSYNRLTFTSTRSIPETYEVMSVGLLYMRQDKLPQGATAEQINEILVLNSGNANVKTTVGTSKVLNGTYTYSINCKDPARVYVVRGYAVVKNSKGVVFNVLSDCVSYSYNTLPDIANS